MKGGTYARALEAGFNDKQAVFLSHLSIDTKDETVERIFNENKKNLEVMAELRRERYREVKRLAGNISLYFVCVLIGIFIGMFAE